MVIDVSNDVLNDLRDRLLRTRWQEDFGNHDWAYGVNGKYLKEVVDHWIHVYDWRRHEAKINSYDHFRTVIDGMPIHYIHEHGVGPAPMPIILNHGWPWTFWDFQKLIGPLTDPGSFGGDPRDAFHVVVPSLPGYGFSTPLTKPDVTFVETADAWMTLMRGELGCDRFAAQGGDWGASVVSQMGHKYADKIIGAHMHIMIPLNMIVDGPLPESEFAEDEKSYFEKNARFLREQHGYLAMQTTRPQTVAYALNDSPVGLLSWILDKRRDWSDCGGDVETRFSKDDIITTVMLYWITQSYGTSARYYYEAVHNSWRPEHDRMPVIEAPTALAVFANEMVLQPRAWAERYYNLKRWTLLPNGGHFGPMEEPQALIDDIRTFFRDYR